MEEPIDKIRVSAGEDLLAFIPHMVGYWPEASVVCIGMAGKQLRATMRLDLPEDGSSGTGQLAAMASSQMASDADADGCLLAIFAPEDWTDPVHQPHAQLYEQLVSAFAGQGLPIKDSWFVGRRYWRNISCTEAACCPWPGTDNDSIRESFVNAEFVYRGSMVRDSPEHQIQELSAPRDPEFVQAVVKAGQQVPDELAAFGSGTQQMAATLGAWEHALSQWPATPDAALASFLLAGLGDCSVRDAVMVALASSAEHSLMGAVGLGIVRPDQGEDVLFPRNWYGGNQTACCPVALEEAQEDAFLTAVNNFSKILVGDLTSTPTGRPLPASNRKGARKGDRKPSQRSKRSATGALRGKSAAAPRGPDWARLDLAEPLLQFLARSTEGPDKAPVLCILGWIQWCKGRGTWAGHYFAASAKYQPGYKLAGLLDQLLAVGYIAECAKDRRTAWQGYGAAQKGAVGKSDVA